VTFYFNLESLVLPDSQVHHFYTSSSRPIFGPSRFEFNGVSSSTRGSVARTIEASRRVLRRCVRPGDIGKVMQVSDGEFDVLGLETGCGVNGEFWDGQDVE